MVGVPRCKLRKILKNMFNNYCKTFKDVPPGNMFR
ncbi:stress response protein AzuC [Escherichia coli]